MSDANLLRRFAQRATDRAAEYDRGTRYNLCFSCGCTVKLDEDRVVGMTAGRECRIEDGDGLRDHMLRPKP